MLDEKDLQAIAQLMDQKLAQQKQDILGETDKLMDQKLARQKEDILGTMDQKLARQKEDILGTMDQKLAQQKQDILGESDKLIDQKLAQQKEGILGTMDQKLARQKQEILSETAHQMKALIDLEVTPKFNLLAEELQNVNDRLDRLTTPEEFEIMDSRMDTLELVVKKHSREIAELKKAQ